MTKQRQTKSSTNWLKLTSLLAIVLMSLTIIPVEQATAQQGTSTTNPGQTDGHSSGGGKGRGNGGNKGINPAVGIGIAIGVGALISEAAKNEKKRTKKVKKRPKKKTAKKKPRKSKPKNRTAAAVVENKIPNEIILKFDANATDNVIAEVLSAYGLRRLEESLIAITGQRIIRAFTPRSFSSAQRRRLQADPRVNISFNYIYQLSGPTQSYAAKTLELRSIHQTFRGEGMLIAVIDSGVHLNHPALKNASIVQMDMLPGKRKIRDNHGTAIASIISAQEKISAAAPGAQILSLRAFAPSRKGKPATGTSFTLASSVNTAVENGAQIINMSFAGPVNDDTMADTLKAASSLGIVLVAAAGNQGPKAPPSFPAAMDEVIAVTATDARNRLFRKANRGEFVHVAAPGVNILVANSDKGVGLMSGTSMATAYVSGGIALIMEARPEITAAEVPELLAATAKDLGTEGHDKNFGYGLMNLAEALASPLSTNSIPVANDNERQFSPQLAGGGR